MSPRRSAAEAAGTRSAILDRAVELASLEGLEGVTIGRLAGDLRMSKSGVLGHFGSKEALQLDALEVATEVFRAEVWEPAARHEPGLPRLRAICDAWIGYLRRDVFPGGCFLTAAACEFDGRGGPVREAVAKAFSDWLALLAREARTAIEKGELPAERDPRQVAFELNALAMGANQALQLHGDRSGARAARAAMDRTLGL